MAIIRHIQHCWPWASWKLPVFRSVPRTGHGSRLWFSFYFLLPLIQESQLVTFLLVVCVACKSSFHPWILLSLCFGCKMKHSHFFSLVDAPIARCPTPFCFVSFTGNHQEDNNTKTNETNKNEVQKPSFESCKYC